MSGLVEKFNIGIFSDTVNVINVKLCMMVLLVMELYLFILLPLTLTIFHGHNSVNIFFLIENFMISSEQVETLWHC